MELKPGAHISERLRLVHPVRKGGMGSVWVAYNEKLKSEVALKFIEGRAKTGPKALARFAREAEIAAKLKHPHVAQMYDHGALDDGTPYIVMELLEGESLHDRLQRGPLSIHETSLVVSQAAQALGKAHKLGIVHRDVKPSNLFLIDSDYELFVKLLDFGIAKAPVAPTAQELTKTGSLLGSPLYMSPEQFIEIKRVDHRADLWSLAVVAYRCLTTVPPFSGEALGNVMMAIMQQKYRRITEVRSQLPAALDGWFAKAFHAELDQRFQSAKELATNFVEIVRKTSTPSEPRPPLPSITDMTHAALQTSAPVESEKTAELPGGWRAALPPADTPTLPLNDDTAKLTAEAATFALAATTLDKGEEKKRVGILMAAAVLLLIGGFSGYVMLGGDEETSAVPAATEPSETVQDDTPFEDSATEPELSVVTTTEAEPAAVPKSTATPSATTSATAAPARASAAEKPQPAPAATAGSQPQSKPAPTSVRPVSTPAPPPPPGALPPGF